MNKEDGDFSARVHRMAAMVMALLGVASFGAAPSAPAADGPAPGSKQLTEVSQLNATLQRDDAWGCRCSFQDPAQTDATFEAGVLGCAPHGLIDDDWDEIHEACASVCAENALINGAAPAARIGPSLPEDDPRTIPGHGGHIWVENACQDPAPINRVSLVADYTALVDKNKSFVRVGDVDSQGNFIERARSPIAGGVAFNVTDGMHIELAMIQVYAEDFSIDGLLNRANLFYRS